VVSLDENTGLGVNRGGRSRTIPFYRLVMIDRLLESEWSDYEQAWHWRSGKAAKISRAASNDRRPPDFQRFAGLIIEDEMP
jgi:hypothetical protein